MTDNDEMTFLKELKEKLKNKKADIEDDLKRMEDNIMTCETVYLENTEKCGNIIKGWESIFTAKPKTQTQIIPNTYKKAKFPHSEYIFSQSSLTNPIKKDDHSGTSGMNGNGLKSSIKLKIKKKINTLSYKKKKLSASSNNKNEE